MDAHPHVYILLLNYRGTDDTFACLDSLQHLNYPNASIIVVDNASPDNSAERLQNRLTQNPDEFQLILSSENNGYSAGNNLGIQLALQTTANAQGYVWLLNNDTTVEASTLTAMVQEAEKTGGLVGSLLLYPDGSYQQLGTKLRWWTGSAKGYKETEAQDGMALETISGASMLIPFKALNRAGLLDESFFLYFEDGEYSLRAAKSGFPLTLALRARVFHKEGATTGRKSLATQYYFHRNRLRLFQQYANPLQKLSIQLYTAFRLLRTVVKSFTTSDAEKKVSARIQWLATQDFYQGISGPCPHNLEALR